VDQRRHCEEWIMGHLSRKFARESKRGKGLMEQYQPRGAYQKAEQQYKEAQEKKRAQRGQG
jgi:hypothetical protein